MILSLMAHKIALGTILRCKVVKQANKEVHNLVPDYEYRYKFGKPFEKLRNQCGLK